MDVVCAILKGSGGFFVAQRPYDKSEGGMWEFPGGKIHDGESPEEAIIREIDEELGINVVVLEVLDAVVVPKKSSTLRLIPIRVSAEGQTPELKEHLQGRFLELEEILTLELCQGDRQITKGLMNRDE